MCCRYQQLCRKRGHRVKVFTQMPAGFARHTGDTDGIIVFTSAVSHNLVKKAVKEAKRKRFAFYGSKFQRFLSERITGQN